MALDIATLINNATTLNQQESAGLQTVLNINNKAATITDQRAADLTRAAELGTKASLVADQARLETQQANLKAANAFGTNVMDVGNLVIGLSQQMRTQVAQIQQKQKEVDDLDASAKAGNPLSAIRQYIFGQDMQSEVDDHVKQFDTLAGVSDRLNQSTQTTVQTQNAISQTLTAQSIKDNAEAQRLLNADKIKQVQLQGLQFGLANVEAMQKVGADQFNRNMAVRNAVIDDQHWQETQDLRKAQFDAYQESRKDKKAQDQDWTDATVRINAYRTANGNLPPVNEAYVKRVLVQPGAIGDALRQQEWAGFNTQNSGGEMVFGATPFEAYTTMSRDNPRLPDSYTAASILTTAEERVSTAVNQVTSGEILPEGTNTYGLSKVNAKDPVALRRAYNKAAQEISASQNALVSVDDQGNPYAPVAIPAVTQANPKLLATPFGQKVLQPLVDTGNTKNDPNVVVGTTLAALNKGDITFNQARDGLTEFYSSAVAARNATGGFTQMGVRGQVGFNTKLDAFRPKSVLSGSGLLPLPFTAIGAIATEQKLFGKFTNSKDAIWNRTLDLTNPADVTLAITTLNAKALADQITESVNRENNK